MLFQQTLSATGHEMLIDSGVDVLMLGDIDEFLADRAGRMGVLEIRSPVRTGVLVGSGVSDTKELFAMVAAKGEELQLVAAFVAAVLRSPRVVCHVG